MLTEGSCCSLPGLQFIMGVSEVADTRVCSNGSPLPLHHVACVGWLSVHNSQKPRDGPFCTKWKHSTTEQVNPCSVTCSPAALQSLLLPFFSVQPGWAMCRLSTTTTLQTVSLNFYRRAVSGRNLDFWFRHHAGFLSCLRPAVGSVFSTPDATVLNVYTVLSQNVSPGPTNMQSLSLWHLFRLLPYCLFFSSWLWLNWYMGLITLIASRKA